MGNDLPVPKISLDPTKRSKGEDPIMVIHNNFIYCISYLFKLDTFFKYHTLDLFKKKVIKVIYFMNNCGCL